MIHHLSVPDMTGANCADVIRKAVQGVDQGAECRIDVPGKRVMLTTALPPSDFIEALEEVGYASFLAQG
ncbi:MAG: heavy-metal-associated domain-containing protein [Usitatibacter sp.]